VSTSSIILKKISEAEQQCENYILEQAAGIVFRGIGVLPRTALLKHLLDHDNYKKYNRLYLQALD
jgi:hypothetical protein